MKHSYRHFHDDHPPLTGIVVGYHATARENLAGILEHGLYPLGDAPGRESTEQTGIVSYGKYETVHTTCPPAVHLAENADFAGWFIQFLIEGNEGEVADDRVVVLRVDLTGLVVREGWDGPEIYSVEEWIAPARISLEE